MNNAKKFKIIIIHLHSGLGNQLFQFNYLNHLRRKYNIKKVYFDLRSYYPGFMDKLLRKTYHHKLIRKYRMDLYLDRIIKLDKINSVLVRFISKIRKYNSKKYNFCLLPVTITDKRYKDETLLSKSRVLFLSGVFLDRNLINNDTIDVLRKSRTEIMKGKLDNFNFKNSVSVHIRGGDVIDIKRNKDYIQPLTVNYYKKAIEVIQNRIMSPFFIIFSNDDRYAESIFSELQIENYKIIRRADYNDLEALYIMSYCNHNIIANSSYSYWAAVINDNKDKIVICPEYFLKPHHFLYQTVQNLPFNDWISINNWGA